MLFREQAACIQAFIVTSCAMLACAGRSSAAPEPTPVGSLTLYLEEMGVKLDCYFTVEELHLDGDKQIGNERWDFSGRRFQWKNDIRDIDDLVKRLAEEFRNVHVYRSAVNPAVIHMVDSRLEYHPNYVLDKRISLDYSGSLLALVNRLHECYLAQLRCKCPLGDCAILMLDTSTLIKCSAQTQQVRRILSDYIPLSRYHRILWTADSKEEGESLETAVQFQGSMRSPVWLSKVPSKIADDEDYDHTTGVQKVNGFIPFQNGEIAYRNNPDPEGVALQDSFDMAAVAFIGARMRADDHVQVRWAMLYLGKRKAENGIPVLLEHIDYRYTTCGVLEESYPAVRALTQIGQPAADAAFKDLLERDESELRVRLLHAVVRAVNGYHPTRDLVEKALASPKDDGQKKRLDQALKLLKDEE